MKKKISILYKTARQYLNFSQEEIAEKLGVSRTAVSQIETNKTQSPNHEYTKYLVEHGINYYYLIGKSDKIKTDSVHESKFSIEEIDTPISELYKTARKHLKISQKAIARALETSDMLISQIETGKTLIPNHEYTKYLVEHGINYYYLIGKSNQIDAYSSNHAGSQESFEQETFTSDSGSLISIRYKTARMSLGLSQTQIAKELDVSSVLISKVELGKTLNPNHEYTKYLVEHGINYFYLIGKSDKIKGQLADIISESDYELLRHQLTNTKVRLSGCRSEYDTLLTKYKGLQTNTEGSNYYALKSSPSVNADTSMGERFRNAREFLEENQSSIARKCGLTNKTIRNIEENKVSFPTLKYIQYLTEQGINYFYLIGKSNEITGQLVDVVSRLDYEKLKSENENLKNQLSDLVSLSEFQELMNKLSPDSALMQMLKNEGWGQSDVRKKGKCAKKQPSRLSLKTGVLHAESPLFAERAVY